MKVRCGHICIFFVEEKSRLTILRKQIGDKTLIRQVNVQSYREDGTPLSLGLRSIPKLSTEMQDGKLIKTVAGYDLVLFCELWICNLSSLPIVFGAPQSEIVSKHKKDSCQSDISRKMAAEAAIHEISSILEFGEKGTVINNDSNDHYLPTDVRILPKQQSNEVYGKCSEW